MHDGDLSFTSCNIVGPGYILASGDILITGNTSIGGGVKILSEKVVLLSTAKELKDINKKHKRYIFFILYISNI